MALVSGILPQTALHVRGEKVRSETTFEEMSDQAEQEADAFAPEDGYRIKAMQTSLPAYFDLRDVDGKNYVTPVKEQTPFGSCWGFAAIAASESSILSSGLAAGEGKTYDTLNLSEKQLAWYACTAINDPDNPQNGEGAVYKEGSTNSDHYDTGGFISYASNLFASGAGPVDEDTETEEGADHRLYAYKGTRGLVRSGLVTVLDAEGNSRTEVRKISYNDMDDWSMPEKYRFRQSYDLKESYLLPATVTWNSDENKPDYHQEGIQAIKEQLTRYHRAVAISFYADHSQPNDAGAADGTYMSNHWAQYYDSIGMTHAVTIVGYDDHYPLENFKEECRPPAEGAWLVKNSWGSDLESFPNNSYRHWGLMEGQDIPGSNYQAKSKLHTGYFWLSYYDQSIDTPETFSFERHDQDYHIDQHDYMPIDQYQTFATDGKSKSANIFTASGDQLLKDVGLFTATPGTDVSFKIYLLDKDTVNPEEGACLYTSPTKNYPYGGYHRETLSGKEPLMIYEGQRYSVVVEEKTPAGKYSIIFGKREKEPSHGSTPAWFKSVINKGESMVYADGAWKDLSDPAVQDIFLSGPNDWIMCMDNFPIKTYSIVSDEAKAHPEVRKNGFQTDSEEVEQGDELVLTADFAAPESVDVSGCSIKEWRSSDESIFTVKESADHFSASVIPQKHGTASLIVDAGKDGLAVVKITVLKLPLEKANWLDDDQTIEVVYTSKEVFPDRDKLKVEGKTGGSGSHTSDLKEGVDYSISVTDNVNCGKAKVTIEGIGDYRGSIHDAFGRRIDYAVIPPKAKITKATVDKAGLKVEFESMKKIGISGYLLSWKEEGSDKESTKKLAPDADSALIEGLTDGKTYEVSLKAYVTTYDFDGIRQYDEEIQDYFVEEGDKDHFGEASDPITIKVSAEESPASDEKKDKNPSDGDVNDPTSVAGVTGKIASIKKDGDLPGSTFRKLRLCSKKQSKKAIRLNWAGVKEAKGYIIYGNRCGTKNKMKKLATVPASQKTWVYKKLRKGTYYKFLILAYRETEGIRKVIASSKTIHVATNGGKHGNYKSVKVGKARITLKKNGKAKIKARPIPVSRKRKPKVHKKVVYETSNSKVASVSRAGVVKGLAKGTCYIYAYAQNGIYKKIKVKVK
jgi:C1A family cysteine protease